MLCPIKPFIEGDFLEDSPYVTTATFAASEHPLALTFYGQFGVKVTRPRQEEGEWLRLMEDGETLIVRPHCLVCVMESTMAPLVMSGIALQDRNVPCVLDTTVRRPLAIWPHYVVVNCVPERGIVETVAVDGWSLQDASPMRQVKPIIPIPKRGRSFSFTSARRDKVLCNQEGCRGRGLLPCSVCRAPTCHSCALVPDDDDQQELSVLCPGCQDATKV